MTYRSENWLNGMKVAKTLGLAVVVICAGCPMGIAQDSGKDRIPARDASRVARVETLLGKTAPESGAPAKNETRFARGVAVLKNLEPDRAIACFTPLLVHAAQKDNKSPANRKLTARYMGWIARALSFDENSVALAQALYIAHQLDPDDDLITMSLADAWERTGRDADAQVLYNRELKLAPHVPFAARDLARLYLAEGDNRRAKEMLDLINETSDDAPDRTHIGYAHLYNGQGFTEKAVKEMEKAAEASEPYQQHLLRATLHKWQHEPDQEEKELAQAGKIFPKDPLWMARYGALVAKTRGSGYLEKSAACRRYVTKALFNYGSAMIGAKKFDAAARCAKHMRMVAPWHEQSLILAGAVLAVEKKDDEIIHCYQDFVKEHPRSSTGYFLLADALVAQNRGKEALSVLKTCTKILPHFAGGWRRLGDVYLADGNWKEAAAAYQHAAELRPSPDAAGLNELSKNEIAITSAGLGSCLWHQGDMQGASRCAHIYNENKYLPRLPWYLKLMMLRPEKIDFDLDSAVAKEREANEHTALADMLFQTKQYTACIAEYRKAIDLNPDSVDLHCYLMNVYSEAGDLLGAAREDWETSSKMVSKIPRELGKLGQRQKKKNEEKEKDSAPHAIPESPQER